MLGLHSGLAASQPNQPATDQHLMQKARRQKILSLRARFVSRSFERFPEVFRHCEPPNSIPHKTRSKRTRLILRLPSVMKSAETRGRTHRHKIRSRNSNLLQLSGSNIQLRHPMECTVCCSKEYLNLLKPTTNGIRLIGKHYATS